MNIDEDLGVCMRGWMDEGAGGGRVVIVCCMAEDGRDAGSCSLPLIIYSIWCWNLTHFAYQLGLKY